MALFGSKEKTESVSKKIRPTVVRTQNIAKEIMKLASSYNAKIEDIDFNILEVQTYIRVNEGGKEAEWEEIVADELYELDAETQLLNPEFQIKQTYEVEFLTKDEDEDLYKDFHLAVGANATKCKIYLSIKQDSEVDYNDKFDKDLLLLINKRKIRAGILINIFDEMLSDAISKVSAHVRVEEHAIYNKSETVLIAESFEPTPTIDDALILHYEKDENKEFDDNEKVDYSARGFVKSVTKDNLLIEYIKPKEGKPGRNCRGEFIAPKEPEIRNEPTFSVDDTIRVVDDEDSIKYYANVNGYISMEGTTYTIKKDMDVGSIDFKSTGSITAGLDSDVTINVKEEDPEKDAIGTGMEVEVTEIFVDGNVGSNAKINAIRATIEGQTHKDSMVRAENLRINVSKGAAYGKKIAITRLEQGTVDGDEIEIAQALGGNIRGKEITIDVCASHVKATASRLIEIKKLHGSENTFIIDPLLKKDAKQGMEKNESEIKSLEIDIRDLSKEVAKQTQVIKDNTRTFNDVKKRLMNYKKNGIKMPEAFVKQYKQFQKMQEHLTNIEKELEVKQDKLHLLTANTSTFQENIFDARIINREAWIGHNELKFILVDPPMEISYVPRDGSTDKIFGLVELTEGYFEIQALEE